MLRLVAPLDIIGGVLRSHGEKTWVAWLAVGVIVVAGIGVRIYRAQR